MKNNLLSFLAPCTPYLTRIASLGVSGLHYTALAGVLSLALFTTATATDFSGSLKGVTITDAANANKPPVAAFTYAINGNTVTFDASGSTDLDGNITKYKWDFGNGTTAEGATATCALTGTASLHVTLTVVDNNNGVGLNQQTVNSASLTNFTGSPGSIETFEAGANAFITPQFSLANPDGIINTNSTAQYHGGAHSAYLGFTGSQTGLNRIRADLGGTSSGFTLSYWLYVSTTSTYNNESIFMLSNHATVPDAYDQNALVTVLTNQGVGTSFNVRIYNYVGGSATTGLVTYKSGSWIKLEYQYRANGTSTVNVYDSSNILQESLSIGSTPNTGIQYFYWGETSRTAQATIRAFYLDDIQYNSTNQ